LKIQIPNGGHLFIDLEHATCYSQDNYWAALTDGKWKYIWFFRTGKEQLFNLKNDPGEITNLSGESDFNNELLKWRKSMVIHLSERGDNRTENERVNQWLDIYKGFRIKLTNPCVYI